MRRAPLFLAVAGAAACSLVGAPDTIPPEVPEPVSGRPLLTFPEVRALWVVRSTMASEFRVRDMIAAAVAGGFNTILVQVRGRGDAFYASELEPRGESLLSPDLDPLELVIELAHARGIAVHAWVNTHLVWGPAPPPRSADHIVNAHPDWLAAPRALGRRLYARDPFNNLYVSELGAWARDNSSTVEGLYTSPSHPDVQEHVFRVWMDLAERYDLDGIHFDYVRFPSADFDYSKGALDRFRVWIQPRIATARFAEIDRHFGGDPYAFVEAFGAEWDDFRRDQITGLVRRIYHGVKERRPELVVSAAVFADQDDARRHRFQEWPSWLAEGILDVAVPMAYTTDDARFERLVRDARGVAGERARVWAGIGAYLNTVEGTLSKIDHARAGDLGGVVLFSYDWAVEQGQGSALPVLRRIGAERFDNR